MEEYGKIAKVQQNSMPNSSNTSVVSEQTKKLTMQEHAAGEEWQTYDVTNWVKMSRRGGSDQL